MLSHRARGKNDLVPTLRARRHFEQTASISLRMALKSLNSAVPLHNNVISHDFFVLKNFAHALFSRIHAYIKHCKLIQKIGA